MEKKRRQKRRSLNKKRREKDLIWTLLVLCAVSVMAVSAWQLLKIYKEYRAGEDAYEEIA